MGDERADLKSFHRSGDHRPLAEAQGNRLDGLRALCALAVVGDHCGLPLDALSLIAVWIFFAISGFLIFPILFRARQPIENDQTRVLEEIRLLMTDRALRILPIYYGILLAVWLWGQVSPQDEQYLELLKGWPWFVTYTTNLYITHVIHDWVDAFSVFWSLAIEKQFYFLFAPCFLMLPSRLWRPALITGALLLMVIVLVFYRHDTELGSYTNSFSGFYAISLGGLAGLGGYNLQVKLRRFADPLLLALMALIVISSALHGSPKGFMLSLFSLPLIAGALLITTASAQLSRLVRLLEVWPLHLLGIVSYGFYIIHLFGILLAG
ncbi:hypothetical protein MMA231_03364 [Asticcacaulis sp. MM231]|uniref:acyltransferase family protein n=1 Tax=Asticcacaulis sp. MM231 TaxID=3157666 RepID=UPI0032D58B41